MDALPALAWEKALGFLDPEDIAPARLAHSLFRQASRGYHTVRMNLVGPRPPGQLDLLAGMHGLRVLRLTVDGGNHELVRQVLQELTARPGLLELRVWGGCSEELVALVYGWRVEGHTHVEADGVVRLHVGPATRPPVRTLSITAGNAVLTGPAPGVTRLCEHDNYCWRAHFCRLPDLVVAVAAGGLPGLKDPPAGGHWDRAPRRTVDALKNLSEAAPGLRALVWGKLGGPLEVAVAVAMRGFPYLRELRLFFDATAPDRQSLLPAPFQVPEGLEVLQLAAERQGGLVELELGSAPRLTRLVLWWVPMALPAALPALRELDLWDSQLLWTPRRVPRLARARFGGTPNSPMGHYASSINCGAHPPFGFEPVRGYTLQGCPCVELQRM